MTLNGGDTIDLSIKTWQVVQILPRRPGYSQRHSWNVSGKTAAGLNPQMTDWKPRKKNPLILRLYVFDILISSLTACCRVECPTSCLQAIKSIISILLYFHSLHSYISSDIRGGKTMLTVWETVRPSRGASTSTTIAGEISLNRPN